MLRKYTSMKLKALSNFCCQGYDVTG